MSDAQWQKDAKFPQNHFTVTPSNTIKLPMMAPIYCSAAGDVSAIDKNGTTIVYTVLAGSWLPIMPVQITAANTTVAAGSLTQIY